MLSKAVRTTLLARPRTTPSLSATGHRHGSSSTHHDEHRGEHDNTVYPKEGFFSPAWRNGVLVSVLALAAWQYAPEPNDEAYLTRWIMMYKTPKEKWLEMNATHAAQSRVVAEQTKLFDLGVAPPVHRLRFPQIIDQGSPFCNGIGMNVDMSNVKVKKEGK
ncbi:hypothetical protein E1B28_009918 [Marasmius oreades]|uniref:Uncharacterized protein n=1 Tax=Marasmius oreades TaxID=181124 RepID=A0A9P7RW14_9AGAR|nr:uncharacterized protein E1B28_009918 [Marasmius oreades]KAG7090836.1 hypothetical protein E1B28_009918 [Marasmius oreades]